MTSTATRQYSYHNDRTYTSSSELSRHSNMLMQQQQQHKPSLSASVSTSPSLHHNLRNLQVHQQQSSVVQQAQFQPSSNPHYQRHQVQSYHHHKQMQNQHAQQLHHVCQAHHAMHQQTLHQHHNISTHDHYYGGDDAGGGGGSSSNGHSNDYDNTNYYHSAQFEKPIEQQHTYCATPSGDFSQSITTTSRPVAKKNIKCSSSSANWSNSSSWKYNTTGAMQLQQQPVAVDQNGVPLPTRKATHRGCRGKGRRHARAERMATMLVDKLCADDSMGSAPAFSSLPTMHRGTAGRGPTSTTSSLQQLGATATTHIANEQPSSRSASEHDGEFEHDRDEQLLNRATEMRRGSGGLGRDAQTFMPVQAATKDGIFRRCVGKNRFRYDPYVVSERSVVSDPQAPPTCGKLIEH